MATSTSRRTSPTALRPLAVELGTLSRSDASASFAFGPVKVVAGLTGPSEVRIRDELTDRATLDIQYQPLNGVAGIPSKSLADSFITAFSSVLLLHHYPRSLVQVILQTLSSPQPPISTISTSRPTDGSQGYRPRQPLLLGPDEPPSVAEKAALINAASLALLDGGIPARGSVAACSCAILPALEGSVLRENSHISEISHVQLRELVRQKKQAQGLSDDTDVNGSEGLRQYTGDTIVLLDPTPTELSYALSTHLFAFFFSGKEAQSEESTQSLESEQILAESLGGVDIEDLQRAQSLCLEASKSILDFLRQALQKRVLSQASR
ncbi:hypothetical protein BCV70DRAFT_200282 [Testicularia cyperi]|uniref:Exoribonuclease phosphorolytic domain-containing protein n=1 Tax=Testicularia cyperi TaxID=1882483 RepID=A0A317XQR0_9BASI|nr:hypothetical protein BCV70DRAFT_200282 [Testicularia cyperi]